MPSIFTALGAAGRTPPWSTECATRPVCQSWAKISPSFACTAAVTCFHEAICAAVNKPGVSGLPSASAEMLMASDKISPAEARWA